MRLTVVTSSSSVAPAVVTVTGPTGPPGEDGADGVVPDFIQSGTGAVERTLLDKMREEVSLTDFYLLDGYTALVNAIASRRTFGGGRIKIPTSLTNWDIDPVAPIEIDFSNLIIEGEGINRSVLNNVSTTGVDLFIFKTAIRTQIEFRDLKIDSAATAGHIFTFDAASGLSFSRFPCSLIQRNPAKSIFDADFSGTAGGLFDNTFGPGNWEHGTGNVWGQVTAPTVPAINIRGNNNRVVNNVWEQLRFQSRFGTAPFCVLDNYGDSAWFYGNSFRDIECERSRRGIFYIAGCLDTEFYRIGHYDCDDIDGHLIETATGAGGKACEATQFVRITRVSGLLVGVDGTEQSVSGITLAGTTATATCVAHGYAVGRPLYIAGAAQDEYNGRIVITAKTDDTFDYEVSGTPVSPATGTITVADAACDVKLGPDDSQAIFFRCGGTTSRQVEVDTRSRGFQAVGCTTSRITFHRMSDTSASLMGAGSSAGIRVPSIQGVNTLPVDTPLGIQIGTTGYLRSLLDVSQALNFGSIAAQAGAELTVTVTGAVVGDEVVANPNSSPEAGLVWNAWVSATDTVTLRVTNVTAAPIDPGNRTWKFRVYQH